MPPSLRDRHILVVEDEFMLAELLSFQLKAHGSTVLGPAPSIPQALALLDTHSHIDAAIVDLNLRGEMGFPVADALVTRGIPFIFTTGYERALLRDRYPGVTALEKPVEFAAIVDRISGLIRAG